MTTDLIAMIGNLSQSLLSVQLLVKGFAYCLGLLFFMTAIQKFRKIADRRTNSSSSEKMFVPTAYLLGGAAMLFLPSMTGVLANTVFGVGNILEYAPYTPYNIVGFMRIMVRTAGLMWFVRGCVLIAHASEPGVQEGPKGMLFLFAGILAMNFDNTIYYIDWSMTQLLSFTLKLEPAP